MVPSIGSKTGTQQVLKALHSKNYITFQKLLLSLYFLEQPCCKLDKLVKIWYNIAIKFLMHYLELKKDCQKMLNFGVL